MQLQRILVISWSLPPLTVGSAIIIGNLAKQFRVDEMIIAGERPYHSPAVAWQDNWPRLHYVATGWPPTWRGIRWRRYLQLPLMLFHTLRLAKQYRCTGIMAVFPKEEHLLIGYLTSLWTNTAFFPYFHNTYLENRQGMGSKFAKALQARFFARAKHVFVMSDGMVDLFHERYPHVACSALVHSFNELLPPFAPLPSPGASLHLLLSGNVNESCQDAAQRMCEAIFRTDNTRLTLLSGTSRAHLEHLGLLREGVCHDTVSRDELLERLQQADIVMLPHGFTGSLSEVEYQTIFPTKTIEYLICGRPILAHTPPCCFLTQFLREHGCALIVDTPSISDLQAAIELLRTDTDLRSRLVRNALKAAEPFQAHRVAARFRAVMAGE